MNRQDFKEMVGSPAHKPVIGPLNDRWQAGAKCRVMSYNRAVQDYEQAPANQSVQMVKDLFI